MSTIWKKEHGEDFEVPAIIEFLVDRGFLVDRSWHNDACPNFAKVDTSEAKEVCFLVDHPIKSRREVQEGPRFWVGTGKPSDDFDRYCEADDLETALRALFSYLAAFHGGAGVWANPTEYLEQMIEEFITESREVSR